MSRRLVSVLSCVQRLRLNFFVVALSQSKPDLLRPSEKQACFQLPLRGRVTQERDDRFLRSGVHQLLGNNQRGRRHHVAAGAFVPVVTGSAAAGSGGSTPTPKSAPQNGQCAVRINRATLSTLPACFPQLAPTRFIASPAST